MKKLLDNPLTQRLLGLLLGAWMRLVERTTRWEFGGLPVAEALRQAGGPVVLVFWHGRLMQAHAGWQAHSGGKPTTMLISQSREGEVIAIATHTLGVDTIRGSTAKAGKDKGGTEAMRAMMRRLKQGGAVAITPDGPKGPRMRAEMGVVQLARLSGAPVVGLAWSTSGRRVFSSWDSFVLPLPFGRGVFIFGEPIRVDRRADDAQMEAARLAVETELVRITQEADRRVGVAPIEPAAPAPATLAQAPAT
ncbi:MAG: lysophospholipid acyltransferase family protein [Hyphomonadaceae bacterium]|nr:lysophospholipid acyltransferase family protein [Hyphomonadaceae bacterium]